MKRLSAINPSILHVDIGQIFILTWPHNNCSMTVEWKENRKKKINFHKFFFPRLFCFVLAMRRVERQSVELGMKEKIHLRCCKRLKKGRNEIKFVFIMFRRGWMKSIMIRGAHLMGSNKYSWGYASTLHGATICLIFSPCSTWPQTTPELSLTWWCKASFKPCGKEFSSPWNPIKMHCFAISNTALALPASQSLKLVLERWETNEKKERGGVNFP